MLVFGNAPNTTDFGTLNRAIRSRQNAMISASVASISAFSVMNAHGVSPHFSSGRATTAASSTAGCRYSTSSTSIVEMFSPPEMMMSFDRSRISAYPFACHTAKSPVWNHPPANASSVAFWFFKYPFIVTLPRIMISPIVAPSCGTGAKVAGSATIMSSCTT